MIITEYFQLQRFSFFNIFMILVCLTYRNDFYWLKSSVDCL